MKKDWEQTYEEWSRGTHLTNAEGKRLYYAWKKERHKNHIFESVLQFIADCDPDEIDNPHDMYDMFIEVNKMAKKALDIVDK